MAHRFPINDRKHFYQLDSLRGLAAAAVMLHHWHIFWLLSTHSKYLAIAFQVLPLRLFIAGHSSVMMFFVLSGFVLSLPQVAGKKVVYQRYLIKRVCRIYLPYLVALGIAILACWKWHGLHAYGAWVDNAWPEGPKWKYVIQNILFLGPYNSGRYNVSFWTLVQEMRISLIFPFLCAFVLRFRARGGLFVAIALFLIDVCLKRFVPLPGGVAETFSYAGMFIFGILLAKYLPDLEDRLEKLRRHYYWAVFSVCVIIYAYTPSLLNRLGLEDASWDCVTAIGASGIILFSLTNKKLGEWLLRAPFLFLGRISYSLYLLHAPILFSFGYIFYNRLDPLIWLIPYVVVTIALSAVMYRTVEASSIHLGQKLTSTSMPTQKTLHAST
jgi:peptidoglycan/LPS O-acetylase OafA/YrhL